MWPVARQTGVPNPAPTSWIERFRAVRARTEALAAPLSLED